MSEHEQGQFNIEPLPTPPATPEQEREMAHRLPEDDRTYLMAHAANAEIDKDGKGIDPIVAANNAGVLYDHGLDDTEYDYIKEEGLSKMQRDQAAELVFPEKNIDINGLSTREQFNKYRELYGNNPDLVFVEFDLNDLKGVNTAQGHDGGDEYIRRACAALLEAGREFGVGERRIFRYGGDEFVVVIDKNDAVSFDNRAHELFPDYTSGIGNTKEESNRQMFANKKLLKDGSSQPNDADEDNREPQLV
jgi:GGDEF domain-containing protein